MTISDKLSSRKACFFSNGTKTKTAVKPFIHSVEGLFLRRYAKVLKRVRFPSPAPCNLLLQNKTVRIEIERTSAHSDFSGATVGRGIEARKHVVAARLADRSLASNVTIPPPLPPPDRAALILRVVSSSRKMIGWNQCALITGVESGY